jgi:hypothetical protein
VVALVAAETAGVAFTVSKAAPEVVEPVLSDTTHRYIFPFNVVDTLKTVKVAVVAPL